MSDRDTALANYMLTSIRKDLEFLKDNQYVNAQTYSEVCALLPTQIENGKRPPLPTRKSSTVSSPHLAPREVPKLPARRSATDTNTPPPPKPSPRLTPPTPQQQQRPVPAARSPSAVQVMPTIPHNNAHPPELAPRKIPAAPAAAAAAAGTAAAVVANAQPEPTPPPAYTTTTSTSIATAEAIYDYQGDDPSTDLSFRRGDVIQITEYVNDDWWRGELNGKSGIFPQNHVKKMSTAKRAVPPKPAAAAAKPVTPATNNKGSVPPPYSYPPPPTQMYPVPPPASSSQQYYPPPPVAAAPGGSGSNGAPGHEGAGGEHEESKVHSMAKKFGGNVANAAVWGFGATVGSEAARAIF